MKFFKIAILASTFGIISSCGGGASTSDSNDGNLGNVASPNPGVTTSPIPTPVATQLPNIQNLSASTIFEFNSEKSLDININSDFEGAHFISLCRTNSTDTTPQYDNCLFSGLTDVDVIQKTWKIANDVEQLALSIWQPNYRQQPHIFLWHRSNGKLWEIHYK